MSEFDLIRRYFSRPAPAGTLGVGDDCALLPTAAGALAVSTDMLLENRHFFSDVAPEALGHKALAVNLSDLAAMGAEPRGFVLGLALPQVHPEWLAGFSTGLHALADRYACPLVGGDTTRSEQGICISVTVFGALDARRALRRDAARPGDDIWVSGVLGEADIALRLLLGERDGWAGMAAPMDEGARQVSGVPDDNAELLDDHALTSFLARLDAGQRAGLLAATRQRLERPEPRVALGLALAGVANAAIDISDGLVQDLGHIVAASRCGATLEAGRLPLADLGAWLPDRLLWRSALGGGDAYELCFTASPSHRDHIARIAGRLGVPVSRVGSMDAGSSGVRVLDPLGRPLAGLPSGFDHFGS